MGRSKKLVGFMLLGIFCFFSMIAFSGRNVEASTKKVKANRWYTVTQKSGVTGNVVFTMPSTGYCRVEVKTVSSSNVKGRKIKSWKTKITTLSGKGSLRQKKTLKGSNKRWKSKEYIMKRGSRLTVKVVSGKKSDRRTVRYKVRVVYRKGGTTGKGVIKNPKDETINSDDDTLKDVSTDSKVPYTVDILEIASKADKNVLEAYRSLDFTVKIDSSVPYSGYFSVGDRNITLRCLDDTIYHELGHFIAFLSGSPDRKDSFKQVYMKEKGSYVGFNRAYYTSTSSEYFAESYRDYVLNREGLRISRPETYSAIESALVKINDESIDKAKKVYKPIWGI